MDGGKSWILISRVTNGRERKKNISTIENRLNVDFTVLKKGSSFRNWKGLWSRRKSKLFLFFFLPVYLWKNFGLKKEEGRRGKCTQSAHAPPVPSRAQQSSPFSSQLNAQHSNKHLDDVIDYVPLGRARDRDSWCCLNNMYTNQVTTLSV